MIEVVSIAKIHHRSTSSVTRHALRETRNSEVTGSEIKGFNKSIQEE
jgi:hypothetical protein